MLRNVFVGSVLAVVIGLIAVAAFLLRDRPQNLPAGGAETADTQQSDAETKFGDRVGADATPAPKATARAEGSPRRGPMRPRPMPAFPSLSGRN
ncbi:hypothetical protein ACRBEV_09875 [Methylobacterium phyllosphaerae]